MAPTVSAVGNYGDGPQLVHAGYGPQNTNTGNGSFQNITHVRQLYHFASHKPTEEFYPMIQQLIQNPEGTSIAQDEERHTSGMCIAKRRQQWLDLTSIIVTKVSNWLTELSKSQHLKTQQALFSQSIPGTGKWVITSEEFLNWEKKGNGSLWLHGIIGGGKSTLMSIIVNHLQGPRDVSRKPTACLYLYLSHEDEEPTLESIYASLLQQLVAQHPPTASVSHRLEECFKRPEKMFQNQEMYHDLLIAESGAFSQVFLAIDALDVYLDKVDPQSRDNLIHTICYFQANWNIIFTTLPDAKYVKRLEPEMSKTVEAHAEDMVLYVEHRIRGSEETCELIEQDAAAESLKDTIYRSVLERAQGIFLLAKMHMDSLTEQKTLGHLRDKLRNLPEDCTKAFDAAIERIEVTNDEVTRHVMTWLLFSKRPVTAEEVRHAYAVKGQKGFFNAEYIPAEYLLTSCCAGTVVIDHDHGILRPVHDTVQDRLRSLKILPQNPHEQIARSCLEYLSLEDFSSYPRSNADVKECLQRYPLLKYAAEHWFDHAIEAGDDDNLSGQVLDFLRSKNLGCAFLIRNPILPRVYSGLQACAYFDKNDWAEQLINQPMDVNFTGEDGQTALHWAVHYKRSKMVTLLIKHGAEVNVSDAEGDTPLHSAIYEDDALIANQLITAKAKLDCCNRAYWTPLAWALKHGSSRLAAVLISNGADVNLKDHHGWTPLHVASRYSRIDLARLLLEKGSDVNVKAKDGWTPLQHAAQYGDESLTSLLIEHQANVDLRDREGGFTPLRWAIMHGHTAVAKLLLDHKADVNTTCLDRITPLIQAAKNGNKHAAWLLLTNNAELNSQSKHGSTALIPAIIKNHVSIAWLLIEQGADLNLADNEGKTAISWAVINDNLSLLWLLLEKGANHDSADAEGNKPLHIAAKYGFDKIINLLVDRGANIDDKNKQGYTALHNAVRRRHPATVNLLMHLGANLDAADNKGRTSLHHAAHERSRAMVTALLEGTAKLDAQDKDRMTPLHHAILSDGKADDDYWNVVWALSEDNRSINLQDSSEKTALIHAAQKGDPVATLCLMKRRADTELRDANHLTARDHAANEQHEVVKFMLEQKTGASSDKCDIAYTADASHYKPNRECLYGLHETQKV
ncbi:hypothetical protein NPX13_g4173 [Xylaria arbuscula]|uniref:Nephrocystin 3-like N-terminal domain-containing protein n=1 Tax=Xylaria arbuscula TaxID=114810 RepID=A0A9W8NH17_9PEZI|nr:hypothetical protein NPX13_g4173 [Xylaria arbuscula]